jgi:hypothetical protein
MKATAEILRKCTLNKFSCTVLFEWQAIQSSCKLLQRDLHNIMCSMKPSIKYILHIVILFSMLGHKHYSWNVGRCTLTAIQTYFACISSRLNVMHRRLNWLKRVNNMRNVILTLPEYMSWCGWFLQRYIGRSYKWPGVGDGEPIRSQLACQPKTNCLLALTEGFYLHNSNPKAKQSAPSQITGRVYYRYWDHSEIQGQNITSLCR